MREIFTDLYKKVLGFFQTQEKENEGGSNKVATNRLKLVLMQDRTNLTPFLLERMRGEMINVLSKYVEMDQEALELNFEQEGDSMALMLSIPVLRAKEEDEIKAILEAEDKAKEETENREEGTEEVESEEDSEDEEDSTESEEEVEETDEDIEEETEEEVCSNESEEESEEIEEEESSTKNKKKKS